MGPGWQPDRRVTRQGVHRVIRRNYPWIRSQTKRHHRQRGCCSQVRVTRLEPTFGASRAFPSADTAAAARSRRSGPSLSDRLRVRRRGRDGAGWDDRAEGGTSRSARLATSGPRRCCTGSGHSPTPARRCRSRGGRERISRRRPARGGRLPAPSHPDHGDLNTGATGRGHCARHHSRATGRPRKDQGPSTEPRDRATHRRSGSARGAHHHARAGTQTLIWGTRRATPARYRLRVRVRSSDGRSASDAVNMRVLRRKSTR